MNALLLMKVKPADLGLVMHRLTSLPHPSIARACMIHGPFDCVVEIHAPTFEEINEMVKLLGQVEGVTEVMTCLITHSWQSAPAEYAG